MISLFGQLISFPGRSLCGDLIILPKCSALRGCENVDQSLAGSDGQLAVEVVLGWQAFLESRGCDSIIASYDVSFLCFEYLDVVLERLIMILFKVGEMVNLLLDHPVGGVLLREDKG